MPHDDFVHNGLTSNMRTRDLAWRIRARHVVKHCGFLLFVESINVRVDLCAKGRGLEALDLCSFDRHRSTRQPRINLGALPNTNLGTCIVLSAGDMPLTIKYLLGNNIYADYYSSDCSSQGGRVVLQLHLVAAVFILRGAIVRTLPLDAAIV
jgi:hypothetical protein